MDETTYEFLTGASAFVIAILGVMLATTKILPESGLAKFRKARNILVPSYFVLSLLSVVCCLTGYDRRIEPASTLFVASFQSLLFTMSILVFIRPNAVRWSAVFRQVLSCLSPCSALRIISHGSFMWALPLMSFS